MIYTLFVFKYVSIFLLEFTLKTCTMYIKVNNETQEISESTTLQMLVENLKIQTNGIAIAINNSVVKKNEWDSKILQQEDAVLIIKSTQGG